MQTHTHKKIILGNALFILLGGMFLGWYYFIDGHFVNKPYTFTEVDPLALQVNQDVYHVGDTPVLFTEFCKTRPSRTTIEWTLIDGQKVAYTPRDLGSLPEGCYPTQGRLAFEIEKIPLFIEETCDAYFIGTATYELSGGRKVRQTFKTERFCVEPAEVLEKVEDIINEESKN